MHIKQQMLLMSVVNSSMLQVDGVLYTFGPFSMLYGPCFFLDFFQPGFFVFLLLFCIFYHFLSFFIAVFFSEFCLVFLCPFSSIYLVVFSCIVLFIIFAVE